MLSPLADRIRPEELEDICGQKHLLADGMPLRNIIDGGQIPNMIFYGPSGVGKTTLANIIAKRTDKAFRKLNGTTASTSDIREIVKELDTMLAPNGVLLYLDEIQYFNKRQQQSLLEYIENGKITLIASTTENPYFYIYNAVLSRSTVFEFKPLTPDDVEPAILRAFNFLQDESGVEITLEDSVVRHIAHACSGDVRKAINSCELCFLSAKVRDSSVTISLDSAKSLTQKSSMRYDRDADNHYDCLSAFQKSMRGSDPDAAVHYLARLLSAGDLPGACRRLLVCASEDVGLAYPQIIPIVKAAVDTALQVGLPEARIPLANAVILVATSPKSNSAICAIDEAMADIAAGRGGEIPDSIKDSHYSGASDLGRGKGYEYSHNGRNHYIKQQFLPDALRDRVYYHYSDNKLEQAAKAYWDKIKSE